MAVMDREAREGVMLETLMRDGRLSVAKLATDLEVSEVTIRAQLKDLEGRGLLTRTHGGAVPTSSRDVLVRGREHDEEKTHIGRMAAELVDDGDSIMIEAGTTTAKIVPHLLQHRGVQIVTNSTLVFSQARHNPSLTVIFTGGSFHRPSESLVGPVAIRSLQQFNVRRAFVGTDGFTRDKGLTTQFSEGAEVLTAMAAQADETWLVTDSSKYGKTGFVRVLGLDEVTGVITDEGLDGAARAELAEVVDLRIAGSN